MEKLMWPVWNFLRWVDFKKSESEKKTYLASSFTEKLIHFFYPMGSYIPVGGTR